jgi:chromosome segregation and condensation protein ScpB
VWLEEGRLTVYTGDLTGRSRWRECQSMAVALTASTSRNVLGNLTEALQSAASLQVKKAIKPIELDYDQTKLKLNVVDRAFPIWLENQHRNDLVELADLPMLA